MTNDNTERTRICVALGPVGNRQGSLHRSWAVGTGTSSRSGKVFDYLGMDLDFELCSGMIIKSMIKYLEAMFEVWPEELKGYTPNPHQDHLFEVRANDDPKKLLLNEEMTSQFHRTTARLQQLYCSCV